MTQSDTTKDTRPYRRTTSAVLLTAVTGGTGGRDSAAQILTDVYVNPAAVLYVIDQPNSYNGAKCRVAIHGDYLHILEPAQAVAEALFPLEYRS